MHFQGRQVRPQQVQQTTRRGSVRSRTDPPTNTGRHSRLRKVTHNALRLSCRNWSRRPPPLRHLQRPNQRKIDWSNAKILLVNMPRHRASRARFSRFQRDPLTPGQRCHETPKKLQQFQRQKSNVLADRGSAAKAPPIVTVGLGCHAAPQASEQSTERAANIRNAIRVELKARWPRGMPHK